MPKKEETGKEEKKKGKEEKKRAEEKKPVKESIHTIGLRRAFEKPRKKRGRAAMNVIRKYVLKHTRKTPKISEEINHRVWAKNNPPRKIKVKISEEEDQAVVHPA